MRKASAPPVTGEGSISLRRIDRPIAYSITTSDGMKTGKGSISGSEDDVAHAFQVRDVKLTLDSGRALQISFLGHTAGSDTAYFEVRRST